MQLDMNFTQEHVVRTAYGSVSVIVYGNPNKPALLTYPDLALNRKWWRIKFFEFDFFEFGL
jgi:hypothetical protein